MSTEERYAVVERRPDGTVLRLGPRALTASAAQQAYVESLRDDVDAPPRMSCATLEALDRARQRMYAEALDRARQRMYAERDRRLSFETCGDPNCKHCAPSWAKLA